MYKNYSELGPKPEGNRDQYAVRELQSSDERKQLISSTRVVCIDIYAEWCGPCKQTAPAYSILAGKYEKPEMCSMVKLNWDKISLEEREKITGIPLFLFYVDGQLVDTVIGADLAEVENKVKACLEMVSSGPNVSRGPQHTRNTIRSRQQGPPRDDAESYGNGPQRQQGYPQGPHGAAQGYLPQGPSQQRQQRPQGSAQGPPQGMQQPPQGYQQRPQGVQQGASQGPVQRQTFQQQNVQYFQ